MTNEEKEYINQQIQLQIKKTNINALYSTSNSTYHLHNGIDSPILPTLSYVVIDSGIPTFNAKAGTIYINTNATSANTRLYINTGTSWAYFTANI